MTTRPDEVSNQEAAGVVLGLVGLVLTWGIWLIGFYFLATMTAPLWLKLILIPGWLFWGRLTLGQLYVWLVIFPASGIALLFTRKG